MLTTKLFHSNRTQAVRLPKPVAFPSSVSTVEIRTVGRSRIIEPAGSGWDEWFDHGLRVTEDFLMDRDQGEQQERAAL